MLEIVGTPIRAITTLNFVIQTWRLHIATMLEPYYKRRNPHSFGPNWYLYSVHLSIENKSQLT